MNRRLGFDWVANTLLALACLQLPVVCVHGDTTDGDAAPRSVKDRIQALSASEKEALNYKKQKFAKLSPAEKQRMRDLHQQIEARDDSTRLLSTMKNYDAWLNTLSASRRAEILALPKDERLKEIRKELDSQNRYRRKKRKLTQEDLEALNEFIDQFVIAHRKELANKKNPIVDELRDSQSSRRFILFSAFMSDRRSGSNKTQEMFKLAEIDAAAEKLSAVPKSEYEAAASDEEKRDMMMRWVGYALMVQMRPPQFKEDVLVEFGESLSAGERKDLEMLGRDKMLHELGRLYMESKMPWHRKFPSNMRDGRGDHNRRRGPGEWGGRGDRERGRREDGGGRGRLPRRPDDGDGPPPPHERPPREQPPTGGPRGG